MKNFKIISSILASVLVSTSVIGCGSKGNGAESPYYSLNIDAEKEYYDNNNEDVQKTSSVVKDFLTYAIAVDYTNANYLKQLDYYDKATKKFYDDYNYADILKQNMDTDQLIRTLDKVDIKEIEFYTANDIPTATASVDYISTVTNASASFFEETKYEINAKYIATMEFKLIKEDNEWKVSERSSSPKTKVE